VDSLTLKLILTPILVGAASLAGRRWGPAVGGWLVALPLTSGPVVFFLALAHGPRFASAVAAATLAGTISQALFCVIYAHLAGCRRWTGTLAASCVGFAAATALLQWLALPLVPLFLLIIGALVLAIRALPRDADSIPARASPLPLWDIPARIAVTTSVVLLLTAGAPILGAQLTGLLAPFPLYATILAVFAHHQDGYRPAVWVLRGLLFGLFSFAGFFLVLTTLLDRAPLGWAFGAAGAVALAVQAASLRAIGSAGSAVS
jgi:hypothetical protein